MPAELSYWHGCDAAISIPDNLVMRRQKKMMDQQDERDIQALIDLSLSELFSNHQHLASDFQRLDQNMLEIYAVKREQVSALALWSRQHRLSLRCVEPQSMALLRVLSQHKQKSFKQCLIHGRADQLSWLIMIDHELIVSRQIDQNILPSHEVMTEMLLPQLAQYEVNDICLSGDVSPLIIDMLAKWPWLKVDYIQLPGLAINQPQQFTVALGLAMGEINDKN
ncbi:MAG: hypothetical protein CMF39_02210 [Legionellaceae bacterium]|nr:hypothetical protein [Legionellaceae bacterium]